MDAGDIERDEPETDEHDTDEERVAHREDGNRREEVRRDEPAEEEHHQESDTAYKSDKDAEIPRESERKERERRKAVYGEAKELEVGIAYFPVRARSGVELDTRPPEPYPVDESPKHPFPLGNTVEDLDDLAVHETKIGGSRFRLHGGDPVENEIEEPGGELLEPAGTAVLATDGIGDFGAVLPRGDEIRDDGRRMLKVGVHGDDGVARRLVTTGGQGDLFAEIPGKIDRPDPGVGQGGGTERLQCPVVAPVVDEDDLEPIGKLPEDGGHLFQDERDVLLLVIDGNDDGNGLFGHNDGFIIPVS